MKKRYILFLSKNADHQWVVDSCGNSAEIAQAAQTMNALRQLPLRQSYIYGDVYSYAASPNPQCSSIQLTVHSGNFSKTTTVNHDYTFHVDVPPGEYEAALTSDGLRVPSNDLNYKDVYCFTVPIGGSAGIAFRTIEHASAANKQMVTRIDREYESRCAGGAVPKTL